MIKTYVLSFIFWTILSKRSSGGRVLSGSITISRLVASLNKQDVFFRINGPASVTQDPVVLKELVERNKEPKAAIKVTVNEAYFHCGKAFRRSGLWNPEKWIDSSAFPTVGKVLKDLANVAEYSPEQLEALYQHGLKEELY